MTRQTHSPTLVGFDQLPDSANVRVPVVAAVTGYSVPSVWRNVKAGRLPQPRRIGPKCTAWNVGDLRRFLAALPAYGAAPKAA